MNSNTEVADLENGSNNPPAGASRPANRPSAGMRYGDMRSALNEAAKMRAMRNQ